MQCLVWERSPHYPSVDATRAPAHVAQQRRLLARWREIFPSALCQPGLDFEDFWEPALTLLAALEAGYPCWEMKECHPPRLTPLGHSRPTPDPQSPIGFLGRLPTIVRLQHDLARWVTNEFGGPHSLAWPPLTDVDHAEHYPFSPVFAQHAGRWFRNAGLASEFRHPASSDGLFDRHINQQPAATPHITVDQALLEAHQRGIRRLFLKVNLVKYQTGTLNLPETLTLAEAHHLVTDFLGYGVAHLEGFSDAVQVQEWVPMRQEYRFLVVDGVPVTGAGIIPEHTPLDADPTTPFSPIVRASAQDPTHECLTDTEIAEYVELAQCFARDARTDNGMAQYTLDVCRIHGRPAVVEVNPCHNMGLYATRMDLWVPAVAASCEARFRAEQEAGMGVEVSVRP